MTLRKITLKNRKSARSLEENAVAKAMDVNPIIDAVNALTPGYKIYVALLNQSDTEAPVATILENTLGKEIVWTRESLGTYKGESLGVFIEGKTAMFLTNTSNGKVVNISDWSYPDSISINSFNYLTGLASDNVLYNATIEIRVYN